MLWISSTTSFPPDPSISKYPGRRHDLPGHAHVLPKLPLASIYGPVLLPDGRKLATLGLQALAQLRAKVLDRKGQKKRIGSLDGSSDASSSDPMVRF